MAEHLAPEFPPALRRGLTQKAGLLENWALSPVALWPVASVEVEVGQ